MDRETRNRIQRATQDARALLEREYAEQLAGTFDVRLDGTVSATPGGHLDAGQRLVRANIVNAVESLRALGHGNDAIAVYVREAAFTTLNRFVALKMLEARGFIHECLSRGEESSGFKEFVGLAPGLVQLTDHGFRLYIESLFDEIGREVRVLFDRRDPASLLWPRRQSLLDLFAILNSDELASVWVEDETIGWVYQYFNSDEERRQMRAESPTPRSSRELAVRNQFFTPRYVVQFLTDNTLGRIWYEMRRGRTKIRDLDYLVYHPREVFLTKGEKSPVGFDRNDDNLAQEELLCRQVYVPFRAKKDPRDIRVLDPACGSGHFLLYAFDLLLVIYEEAYADEASPKSDVTGKTLREDYADLAALRAAVPGLILRHNLHGIDIDGRCAQIGALALWMKAQRAYKDLGVARDARRPIEQTNIVVSEPMPGQRELRREFIATIDSKLSRLVERVFDRMELAGEAGSLLRIEDDIHNSVREIYGEHGRLFRTSDERRWRQAEEELRTALPVYAERASNGHSYQRRLFAKDAARGLGFIDICTKRYQVVLMNPPFGPHSPGTGAVVSLHYSDASGDLGFAFVSRGQSLLDEGGVLGAITNRTLIANRGLESWRRRLLLGEECSVSVFADLGFGVMDAALVFAAAFVLTSSPTPHDVGVFFRLLSDEDKGQALHDAIAALDSSRHTFLRRLTALRDVPESVLAYHLPSGVFRRLSAGSTVVGVGGRGAQGLITGNDFRFLRLWWEVPGANIGPAKQWAFFAKGGEYSPYWDAVHLLVNWSGEGSELRSYSDASGALLSRPQNVSLYFRPGITYPERTASDYSPRPLPAGCIFSATGQGLFLNSADERIVYVAGSYTRAFKVVVEALLGSGDTASGGSPATHYRCGAMEQLPLPIADEGLSSPRLVSMSTMLARLAMVPFTHRETSYCFGSLTECEPGTPLQEIHSLIHQSTLNRLERSFSLQSKIEEASTRNLGFQDTLPLLDELVGPHPLSYSNNTSEEDECRILELASLPDSDLVLQATSRQGARRQLTKKSYLVDRRIELIAHTVERSALAVIRVLRAAASPGSCTADVTRPLVQLLIGMAFRRFGPEHLWRICAGNEADLFDDPRTPRLLHLDEARDVMVEDRGHENDIVFAVESIADSLWGKKEAAVAIGDCVRAYDASSLRDAIADGFFSYHLSEYSASRRRAPIYWQLATPSTSYSVWLYYHRFTRDTMYRVVNDYVTPKLKHEERKLIGLTQDAGPNPSASQRKEIDAQERFVDELRVLREEAARVAPLWNPDLNDGVIVNFAPLWRLVPQNRPWQKACKAVWDKLVAGDYDWAHLAMHLWPERVVPKCAEDRSLAIAHGLDNVFWEETPEGTWKRKKMVKEVIGRLVDERTSAAVKAAVDDLLRVPVASGTAGRRRGAGRRRSAADGNLTAASRARAGASPT